MILKLFVLIIISLNYQNTFSAEVDQECTIDGEKGVCKLLRNCERAVDELNFDNKLYTLCTPEPSYADIQPIVCCLPTQAEIDERIPDEWMKYDISERKCLEYARRLKGNNVYKLEENNQKCHFDEIPSKSGRIKAADGEFPHMVIFGYERKEEVFEEDNDDEEFVWKCSGSLISDFFVLTSTHCNKDKIEYALLGISKILDYLYKEVRGIESTTTKGKLALIKLDESVSFNQHILPLCLPLAEVTNGTKMIESGWVQPFKTQNLPLLRKEIKVLKPCCCKETANFDKKKNICAKSKQNSMNDCIGNSGGPIVIRHSDTQRTPCMYTIHGVVTQASCNNKTTMESIYTKLSPDYLQWIKCKVWDVCIKKN